MSDKEKIKLQQWWMEQLRDLTRKVMKEEEKRQAKVTAKASSMLSEYSSRDDIVEAYGMGPWCLWLISFPTPQKAQPHQSSPQEL